MEQGTFIERQLAGEEMVAMRRTVRVTSNGWRPAAAVIAMMVVVGCGGGGGGVPTTTSGSAGSVSMAVTDAAHTDVSVFTVDVTSIVLQTVNGAGISVLPATATVNFADLSGTAQLLSTASIPQGIYPRAVLTLDFATSDTLVVLANGNSTATGGVALRDGATGKSPTTMQVVIEFDSGHPLVVGADVAGHVLLDFNLDQSLDIDESGTPNVVTIRPVISGDADHLRPRPTRIGGLLAGVDVAAGVVAVAVHPLSPTDFGLIPIATDTSTKFSGDDLDHDGDTARSLADLAAAPARSPVVATANFSPVDGKFHAQAIEYGNGMPGPGRDVADGLLVDISGSTYTLIGATLSRASGEVSHNVTVTATLNGNTIVRSVDSPTSGVAGNGTTSLAAAAPIRGLPRAISITPPSLLRLGIGQHLFASGVLSGTAPSFSLDCTATTTGTTGTVCLEPTDLIGCVVTSAPGTLTVNVKAIGRRPVEAFNFAAQGTDPTLYGVATSVPAGTFTTGAFVLCGGIMTPQQPDPFTALVVAPFADAQVLEVHWPSPGTSQPFTFPQASVTQINLAGGGAAVVASLAGPSLLSAGPTLALGSSAAGAGIPQGPLAIAQGGAVTQYGGDAATQWLIDLKTRIGQGGQVQFVKAVGSYNSATNVFTAQMIIVVMQ